MKSTEEMLGGCPCPDPSPGPIYWKMRKCTRRLSPAAIHLAHFLTYNVDRAEADVAHPLPVLSILVVANSGASQGQAGDYNAG